MTENKSSTVKAKSKLEEIPADIKKIAEAEVSAIDDPQLLREKRDEYNEKTKKLNEERKRIETKIKDNSEIANNYREQRDSLNEKVKELKEKRAELYKKIDELREKLNKIREKERKDKKDTDFAKRKQMLKKIQRQIKALETKIITEELDIQTENEYVQKIQELECKKAELEGSTSKSPEFKEIKMQINDYRNQVKLLNDEINECIKEAKNYHLLMLDQYKENDMFREQLKKINQEMFESKIIADEFHFKYLKMGKQRRSQRKARYGDPKSRMMAKKEIHKEVLKEALDKKKKGQKLNIFEARALFENAIQKKDDKSE
ncbi:MAG: DUF7121 family protein [Promethearchaeota archaeon]